MKNTLMMLVLCAGSCGLQAMQPVPAKAPVAPVAPAAAPTAVPAAAPAAPTALDTAVTIENNLVTGLQTVEQDLGASTSTNPLVQHMMALQALTAKVDAFLENEEHLLGCPNKVIEGTKLAVVGGGLLVGVTAVVLIAINLARSL